MGILPSMATLLVPGIAIGPLAMLLVVVIIVVAVAIPRNKDLFQ